MGGINNPLQDGAEAPAIATITPGNYRLLTRMAPEERAILVEWVGYVAAALAFGVTDRLLDSMREAQEKMGALGNE